MIRKTLLTVFLITCIIPNLSFGAMTAYLKVTGSKQGELKGDCTQSGREDLILVYAHEHSITAVRDNSTCQPNGQVNHQALKICKHIDKSTPLLMEALVSHEKLDVQLDLYRINPEGSEENYFTIKLQSAYITGIRTDTPFTFLEANKPYRDMEYISFSYGKIIKSEVVAGTEAEADWQSDCGQTIRISDLNFDGVVNMLDMAIMADEWLLTN